MHSPDARSIMVRPGPRVTHGVLSSVAHVTAVCPLTLPAAGTGAETHINPGLGEGMAESDRAVRARCRAWGCVPESSGRPTKQKAILQ